MTSELTLVPPGRLAALLSTARRRNNMDTAQIAQRSGGRYSPGQLDEIERGRVLLADQEVEALTDLYQVDVGPIVPERSRLIVDLGEGRMTVGESGIAVGTGSGEVDVVLERYLSLLYIMRGLEPGSELTLRDRDLAVLGESLEQELRDVERRLSQLMAGKSVQEKTGLLGRRFALPAAGLLVALTAIGSLVIIGGGSGSADLDASPVNTGSVAAQVDAGGLATPVSTGASALGGGGGILVPASFGGGSGGSSSAGDSEAAPAQDLSAVTFTESSAAPADAFVPVNDVAEDAVEVTSAEVTADTQAPPVVDAAAEWAQLGAEAEALINYDWESVLPGWNIEYVGDMPGYRGMTHTSTNSIAIYINAGDTAEDVAGILAHEIGHAIDVTYLDDQARSAWLDARGMPRAWWPGSGLGDFHVGAGDWAEGVAALITGSSSDSAYGEFTAEQLALVQQLLPGGGGGVAA